MKKKIVVVKVNSLEPKEELLSSADSKTTEEKEPITSEIKAKIKAPIVKKEETLSENSEDFDEKVAPSDDFLSSIFSVLRSETEKTEEKDYTPKCIRTAVDKGWITEDFVRYLYRIKFFTKPASLNHHLNVEGGLFEHSLRVTETLIDLTEKLGLKWQNERSPFIVGMFHDICKADNYSTSKLIDLTSDEESVEQKFIWNTCQVIKGHGDKSVMMLAPYFQLTEEEMLCIRYHMGAYETEAWEQFDKAILKYPTVLWTHTADMWASKVIESYHV